MAARAVDGRTDGAWAAGSVTCTGVEAGWLEIDLGAVTTIGSVVLHNRTDCCAERLIGAYIELSVQPCERRTMIDRSAPVGGTGATHTRSFFPGVPARYVCVRHKTAKYLSLAEVQVFPPAPPPEADACAISPCAGANTVCTDRLGADTSAAGRTCGCAGGFQPGAGGACVDVDECAADTDGCLEGCENRPGTFVCVGDDAWLVAGEAAFPGTVAGGPLTVFSNRTSVSALRVPSSVLDENARVEVNLGGVVAIGATVARAAGATTDLPLPYTFFAHQQYRFTISTGTRTIEVGVPGAAVAVRDLRFATIATEAIDLSPPGLLAQAGGHTGLTSRAYEVRFAERTSIVGIGWKVASVKPDSPITARVWDEQGNLLARGLAGDSRAGAWVTTPLTFTFEPGRTYLIGVHDPSRVLAFERKIALDPSGVAAVWTPYNVGAATVVGLRSTRTGEADVAPTAANLYAPLFELVLSAGACAEGTCRP